MNLGTRLRALRQAQGLTQKELAEPRYTHAYVSTIESGRRHPSPAALAHFAGRLGVEVDELVTGRPPDLVPRLEIRLHEARVALSAGDFEGAGAILQDVAKEAHRFDLPRLESKTAEGRALWAERRGQAEDAIDLYQQAEDLLVNEPLTARVDAIAGKARCFEMVGDISYAVYVLESLLGGLEREGLRDPNALIRVHASLCMAYIEAGLFKKADASAHAAFELAPDATEPARIAQMHMNVARVLLAQGQIDDAHESLIRAGDIYRKLELQTEMGGAHLARGIVLSGEGDLANARAELTRARDIFEQTNNRIDAARALCSLGRVERLDDQTGTASETLGRAIDLVADADTPVLAWAHREMGLTLGAADSTTAEKHLRVAIDLFERSEQTVDLAITYGALGDVLKRADERAGCDAYRTGLQALEKYL